MPPFHIKDESDYIAWVEESIEEVGGWLQGILEYELLEYAPGEFAGAIIRKSQVLFPRDGSILSFGFHLDGDLALRRYSFDYRDRKGVLIWRKDLHKGHEELGGLEHIHRGVEGEGAPERFISVEIDEVLEEVMAYLTDGSLP